MPRRSKADELLDFEIAFYEKLVSAYPDFADALIPLGNAYTRRGLYEKGLAIDVRLTRLRAGDAIVWYNLACSYSLLNRIEDAFSALRRALDLGYADLDYLRKDPDLHNLRTSSRYRELLNPPAPQPSA
jgi:tetratricopeptide (TPR) repeat protein